MTGAMLKESRLLKSIPKSSIALLVLLLRAHVFAVRQDGFYRTLKRRSRVALAGVPRGPNFSSALIADLLALGTIAFSVLAAAVSSYSAGALAGFLVALNVVTAHNFLHQKDNFRMYYFNLSFMSFRYVFHEYY
jgi:hypothetical protein